MKKSNDENKKQPGIIETVRQINRQEEITKQEHFERLNETEREEYGKKNAEEKREILKVRQGFEDKLEEDEQTEIVYTFPQKVGNFFYHNKWWLGITTFLVLIAAFLIYDTLTTVHSDVRVMLLSDADELAANSKQINDFFNSCVKDYNEDDRKYVDLVYIPISKNMEDNLKSVVGYENSLTNLSTQFQLGECMMLLADDGVNELIDPENTLENLEVYFPGNKNIDGYKYYLKNTDFAQQVGVDNNKLPDDLFLAVRRIPVYENLSPEETNKQNHDRAVETFKTVVRTLEHEK